MVVQSAFGSQKSMWLKEGSERCLSLSTQAVAQSHFPIIPLFSSKYYSSLNVEPPLKAKKRKVSSKIFQSDLLRASDEFFANLTDHDQCVREEGEQRGVLNARRTLAKLMREKNKPLSEIMEFTGLSEEEINKL